MIVCIAFLGLFLRAGSVSEGFGKDRPLTLPARTDAGRSSPPLVGRPVDFSGAIGGPFVVQWHAEPTTVNAEEPLTLTLRITGPGNLREMPRPGLAKLDSFKPFALEDLDDRFVDGNPPRREFRYRLRPRTADVKEIPRFKLVYFNPHVVPASRGYQTTYADALPLVVQANLAAHEPVVPDWIVQEWEDRYAMPSRFDLWRNRLPDWLGVESDPDRRMPGSILAAIALASPVLICAVWYAVWSCRNPGAARLAQRSRSRAAAVALRGLRRPSEDVATYVQAVICDYLHSRAGLPATASTPAEVGICLERSGFSADRVRAITDLLRKCDRARFSPGENAREDLCSDAERAVLALEGSP